MDIKMNKCIECQHLQLDLSKPIPKHGFFSCDAFFGIDFVKSHIDRNIKCLSFHTESQNVIDERLKLRESNVNKRRCER